MRKANEEMSPQKMKAVIENATRNTQATVWLDRFRSIRESKDRRGFLPHSWGQAFAFRFGR
jgi:hypothetical protein